MTDPARRAWLVAAAGSAIGPAFAADVVKPRVIRVGHALSDDSQQGRAIAAFARDVDRLSAGRLKVRGHGNSSVGNDVQLQQQLIAGSLDMMVGATATMVAMTREMALWDTPFLFRSSAEADALLDGPVGDRVRARLMDKGMIGLVYWEDGFRHVTNSVRPIRRIEDFSGLQMRVMQNAVFLDSFKALGADAVPTPFPDVLPGLEAQTLQGQENSLNTILSARIYTQQKYLSLTRHAYSPWLLAISRRVWDSLTAVDRQVIQDAATRSRGPQRDATRAEAEYGVERLTAHGMQVNTIATDEQARFRDRLIRINASVAGSIGMDLWREAQAQLAGLRAIAS